MKKHQHRPWLIMLIGLSLLFSGLTARTPSSAAPDSTESTYQNPIMSEVADAFADPAVIRAKDGFWYAYATNTALTKENAEAGGDPYLLPIVRTKDLKEWELVGTTFDEDNHPTWRPFPGTGYWAPDVRYVNGEYRMYYSLAGGNDAAIGLATAPTPAGPWTDSGGPVVDFVPDPEIMEIDPALFIDDDGTSFLYYGSFRDGGMWVVELSEDGTRPVGEPKHVVSGHHGEAPWVVQRDGFYYLFFSAFGCCAAGEGAYPVFVGRSTSPTGPFVDAEGQRLTGSHPGGTLVNSTTGSRLVATGHNAIAADRSGQDWIFLNSNDRRDPSWGGRPTSMDRLDWIGGWPTVRAGEWTSTTPQQLPIGSWDVGSRFEEDQALDSWEQVAGSDWELSSDPQSGAFVGEQSTGNRPSLLVSEQEGATDYRAEADLQVKDGRGAAGLIFAFHDQDNHVRAWLNARTTEFVVETVVAGRVRAVARAPLPQNFDFAAWHAVTAQVRGTAVALEVTNAMEGSTLAQAEIELPDDLAGVSRVGVASRRGAGADNVGVTALYQPVTEKVPDPTVGPVLPEFTDEFDSDGQDPAWSWLGTPDGDEVDGAYEWDTQDADLGGQNPLASVMLCDAPEGTYTVETKLHFPLGPEMDRTQVQAGIIAWNSREDSIHIAPTTVGTTRQTFLWIGRDRNPWPEMQLGTSADTLWLRLRHTVDPDSGEHHFRAATSRDGEHWIWAGTWQLPQADAAPRIGLVSMGGTGGTATFDYLRFYGPGE